MGRGWGEAEVGVGVEAGIEAWVAVRVWVVVVVAADGGSIGGGVMMMMAVIDAGQEGELMVGLEVVRCVCVGGVRMRVGVGLHTCMPSSEKMTRMRTVRTKRFAIWGKVFSSVVTTLYNPRHDFIRRSIRSTRSIRMMRRKEKFTPLLAKRPSSCAMVVPRSTALCVTKEGEDSQPSPCELESLDPTRVGWNITSVQGLQRCHPAGSSRPPSKQRSPVPATSAPFRA